jgi:hypothetical protein
MLYGSGQHRPRLVAEMKVPGLAWLEFEVTGNAARPTIRRTAVFDPLGLFGLFYWYALYPEHRWVFAGMLPAIVKTCHAGKPGEGTSAATVKCAQEP